MLINYIMSVKFQYLLIISVFIGLFLCFQLQMWIENPREELILENALKCLEPPFTEGNMRVVVYLFMINTKKTNNNFADPKLATRIYYFLYRYGYFNFGVFQQKSNIIPGSLIELFDCCHILFLSYQPPNLPSPFFQ